MHYVDTGKDRPGGSDARFWKQYLSEEEGEPIFGFSAAAQQPEQPAKEEVQPDGEPATDKPTVDGEAA